MITLLTDYVIKILHDYTIIYNDHIIGQGNKLSLGTNFSCICAF